MVQHATLQETILLWQDSNLVAPFTPCLPIPLEVTSISLQQVRIPVQPSNNVAQDADTRKRAKLNEHWAEFDVVHQLRVQLDLERRRRYTCPQPRVMPVRQCPVYLYIFSGRRRENDFQSCVEHRLQTHGISGQVLLIDLALSDKHDVGDVKVVQLL